MVDWLTALGSYSIYDRLHIASGVYLVRMPRCGMGVLFDATLSWSLARHGVSLGGLGSTPMRFEDSCYVFVTGREIDYPLGCSSRKHPKAHLYTTLVQLPAATGPLARVQTIIFSWSHCSILDAAGACARSFTGNASFG